MITQWLIDMVTSFVQGLLDLVPLPPIPDWLSSGAGAVGSVAAQMGALSNWIPVTVGVAIIGTILAIIVAAAAVKVVRIIASFLTAGGGSAA